MRLRVLTIGACIASLAVGCGESADPEVPDESRRVEAVVSELYGSMAERDAARFCALLADQAKRDIREIDLNRRPSRGCVDSAQRVLASTNYTEADYRVLDVATGDGEARVSVAVAGSTVDIRLIEVNGRWKAASLGRSEGAESTGDG